MIPFAPPVLDGVTVYAPAPKPLREYVPAIGPGAAVVVETFGEPSPLIKTFETNLGVADAFTYVTVPDIESAGVDVGVEVGVSVEVDVGVEVFVSVGVGVFVAVGVGVPPPGSMKA